MVDHHHRTRRLHHLLQLPAQPFGVVGVECHQDIGAPRLARVPQRGGIEKREVAGQDEISSETGICPSALDPGGEGQTQRRPQGVAVGLDVPGRHQQFGSPDGLGRRFEAAGGFPGHARPSFSPIPPQYLLDPPGVGDRRIGKEGQLRQVFEPHLASHRGPDPRGGRGQRPGGSGLRLLAPQHRVVDRRVAEIGRGGHAGDGQETQAGVLEVAAFLGDHLPEDLVHPPDAPAAHRPPLTAGPRGRETPTESSSTSPHRSMKRRTEWITISSWGAWGDTIPTPMAARCHRSW